MSDYSDNSMHRTRRRLRSGEGFESTDDSVPDTPPPRRHVVIAKHEEEPESQGQERRMTIQAIQDETDDDSNSGDFAGGDSRPAYSIQKNPTVDNNPASLQQDLQQPQQQPQQSFLSQHQPPPHPTSTDLGTGRLASPPSMSKPVKLIDDYLTWCENTADFLQDQTEFLTIGVIGLQGTGKSTILSRLAGDTDKILERHATFPIQNRDHVEQSLHRTEGIDMYVTPQRTILLDCQPVLSSSIMSMMIQCDYKYLPEYRCYESCIHMESLQLATFMLTVCDVIVVTMDWFIDTGFIKFLQTAEVMKPHAPTGASTSSSATGSTSTSSSTNTTSTATDDSTSDDGVDSGTTTSTATNGADTETENYHPQIVFVLNKAEKSMFNNSTIQTMQKQLAVLMANSLLNYRGYVSMDRTLGIDSWSTLSSPVDVNLYLLPDYNNEEGTRKDLTSAISCDDYQSYPSYSHMISSLEKQILAMPKRHITLTTLSERSWFSYAAKTWESIKKSTLLSEYNRLLGQSLNIE